MFVMFPPLDRGGTVSNFKSDRTVYSPVHNRKYCIFELGLSKSTNIKKCLPSATP